MSNEPTDVGPAVGGHLPVSQQDKDQVLHLLQAAHDDGRLTFDELTSRTEAAVAADTFDDLIPLTRDLVPLDQRRTYTLETEPSAHAIVDPTAAHDNPDWLIAVFSGSSRKGNWRVRKKTTTIAAFGGVDVDLSQAVFESDVIEITTFCAFGGVTIIVPEGTRVIDRTAGALFGGIDVKHPAVTDPDQPTVIVKGFVMFGGVDVKPPKQKKKWP